MKQHKHNKTNVYVTLGIIIVVVLGVYIYIALSSAQTPAPAQNTISAEELARQQQRALLVPFTPTKSTASQIQAQRALLKKY